MPISILSQTDEQRQTIYVVGAALLAGIAHIGRLLYENEPVPLRKAVGGSILTLCVGGAGGALCTSYWELSGSAIASGAIVLGFIGGPFVLRILGKIGERSFRAKSERLAGQLDPLEEASEENK